MAVCRPYYNDWKVRVVDIRFIYSPAPFFCDNKKSDGLLGESHTAVKVRDDTYPMLS